jgi:hypothetical protein
VVSCESKCLHVKKLKVGFAVWEELDAAGLVRPLASHSHGTAADHGGSGGHKGRGQGQQRQEGDGLHCDEDCNRHTHTHTHDKATAGVSGRMGQGGEWAGFEAPMGPLQCRF